MKFLVCGIGSAGQRHYKNIVALGHTAAVFRSRTATNPFIASFLKAETDAGRPPKLFYGFGEAIRTFRPDAVVITTPNAFHMDLAIPAARAGCHIFLEKPVSHTLAGAATLERIAKKKKLIVAVGYMLRFHPLLRQMKERFEAGEIGDALAVRIENAENIEDWHPWEDYKKTYAPFKKTGGGVVLCFSHDLDYLYWFFGLPRSVAAAGGKMTPLAGDAEDMIEAVLTFPRGMVASVHLDYWQRPRRRVFEIIGTRGKFVWDYYARTLSLVPRDAAQKSATIALPENFDRNEMFVEEMRDFITAIESRSAPVTPLAEGIAVLKLSVRLKKKIGF